MGQALRARDRHRAPAKAGTATLDAGGGRLWLDPGTHVSSVTKVKGKAGVELVEARSGRRWTRAPRRRRPRAPVRRRRQSHLLRCLGGDSEGARARLRAGADGPAAGAAGRGLRRFTAEIAAQEGPGRIKLAAGSGSRCGRVKGAGQRPHRRPVVFGTARGACSSRCRSAAARCRLGWLPFKGVQGAARYRVGSARRGDDGPRVRPAPRGGRQGGDGECRARGATSCGSRRWTAIT